MGSLPLIYLRLVSARVRGQVQYRLSFLLQVAGAFALSFVDFLVILVIFQHLPALAGWTLAEVAFLYGSSYVTFKLVDMAIGQIDQLGELIQSGGFDLVLIRPLGTLFQVLTSDFQLRHAGAAAQGVLVFAFALARVDVTWTPARLAMLLAIPLCGGAIFAGIWIIGGAATFWTTRTSEVTNAFTYGGNELTSYPMHIYGDWMRRLFIFLIPLAFVNYYPALYILDKPDPIGMPVAFRFLAPLAAVALLWAALTLWQAAVRRYRSTGS